MSLVCFLKVLLVLWTIKQGCINSSRQLPVTSFTKRKQNPLPGRTETDPSQSTSPPAGISHAESESLALVTSRNGNQNRSKDLVRRAAARRVNQVRRGESSERACRASDLSRLACDKLAPSTATTVTNTHTLTYFWSQCIANLTCTKVLLTTDDMQERVVLSSWSVPHDLYSVNFSSLLKDKLPTTYFESKSWAKTLTAYSGWLWIYHDRRLYGSEEKQRCWLAFEMVKVLCIGYLILSIRKVHFPIFSTT